MLAVVHSSASSGFGAHSQSVVETKCYILLGSVFWPPARSLHYHYMWTATRSFAGRRTQYFVCAIHENANFLRSRFYLMNR